MDQELFSRVIANILQTEVRHLLNGAAGEELLADFEGKHCFSRELQPMFTREGLSELIGSLPAHCFTEVEGQLRAALMLFRFDGAVFLVGPYVREPYNERAVQVGLASHRVSYSRIHAFRLYYTAMPLLVTETVTRVLGAVCRAFDANAPLFETRRIRDFRGLSSSAEQSDAQETEQIEDVYRRYRIENRLLAAIRSGQTGDALRIFDRHMSAANLPRSGAVLYRNPQVSYSILRTLLRKAAEEGGLSVVTIDTITQRHAQLSAAANSAAQQYKYARDLARDLTDAVHKTQLQSQDCAPETRAILEYLHLHYAENVRIEDLTALTGYSRSHISTVFKRDKGRSILSWLAMLRCHKAQELLENTDASVSDIAATAGYDDANYFVKVYKKEFGETPSETRAKRT